MPVRRLVLASTSRYRSELLQRLHLSFTVRAPAVDETELAGETPRALALRLALAKADAVADLDRDALVIGSDQVADLDGRAIGKPGDHARATAQLRSMRGRTVVFHTAVAVVCIEGGFRAAEVAPVTVRFRDLSDAEIEHYLATEQPYDCAGSAKAETLGIALLEAIESDDPTALIGLPLIRPVPCSARRHRPAGGARRLVVGGIAAMTAPGRLHLIPNTLDFGTAGAPAALDDLLPLGVIRTAARLRHWVCENAKTTRAFLQRVDAVCPLAKPLQELSIVELPRPNKARETAPGSASVDALLAPARTGHDLGLLSEAAAGARRPGALLVAAAHAAGIAVVAHPARARSRWRWRRAA